MADLTGQRLGQYLILERISKGATSTVYKGYQEKLERYVAVKVLSPHFIDEEGFLERFKQEARAVAQLDHPNILPVYDFDQAGEIVYIVMKYVDTGTLKELVGEPLDLRVTLEVFTQVGLALGYAHRQGVIHRDVKPGNILLGEGNWALLTDFGLAKMRVGARKLTKSGIGMGTPDYMSPEQAQGMPVDARADLYSLGCMLHEMVTGRVPFEADSGMAVVVKHITEPPRPPREINPRLSLAVEQVILRALEKDPNRRYQTAEGMVADLSRAVGGADRFVLPDEIAPQPAASRPARAAASVPGRQPAPAIRTRYDQMRYWLSARGSSVALALRRAIAWLAAQLRRAGRAIRAGLARAGSWLRQRAIALAALVRSLPQRQAKAPARARRTSTRSRPAATRRKPSTAKRSPAARTPGLAVQAVAGRLRRARQAVRERSARRRLMIAGLIVLFLVLAAIVLLLRPFDSWLGASALRAGSVGTRAPTAVGAATVAAGATESAATPASPTDTPSPVDTPTPLPEAPAGMVAVAGGRFLMGATGGSFDADETPPHWVSVSPFYIDVVEVSVAQFARFAGGSGYVTDAEKKGDATTWRVANTPDRQRFPITRVSWNDAAAFCRWYGKRLPTEAEWELAAKGYSENIYSWGNAFSVDRANTQERGVGQPIAIASLANVSPFGAYDMIGNVWEWVSDWYGGDYYANSPAVNPRGPASGLQHVIRGGSFKSTGERATTTIRRQASQDGWADDVGFRCVKDVPSS